MGFDVLNRVLYCTYAGMGDNADMQGVNVCCARSTPPGFNANGTESLFYLVHSQPLILNFFLLKYVRPLKCLRVLGE